VSKVAVVCHDAGGSEIISSWIMKNLNNYSFYLQGPAKKIFKDKINATSEKSLNSVISNCDWLLCGTSWQSELEKKAIQIAKNSNIKSISYIDHWVNYEERFIYNDNILLPDEIWVADKEALEIATKIFLNTEIKLIENEYLKSIQKEVEKIDLPKYSKKVILYVCEPIAEHAQMQCGNSLAWGYDEHTALKYFLDNFEFIDRNIEKIILRPHPSEKHDKYDWAINYCSIPIHISPKENILKEIKESLFVVGCESMAMVIGLISGKRVVSCIPPNGRECMLPHKNISKLKNLINSRSYIE
tara:strand:- start:857 stop:1756 length:900 start_codon:yes stop_codon:yes gene_type:complete